MEPWRRKYEANRLTTLAAMIDRIDQQVGRLIAVFVPTTNWKIRCFCLCPTTAHVPMIEHAHCSTWNLPTVMFPWRIRPVGLG
jgi:hypothetical protein